MNTETVYEKNEVTVQFHTADKIIHHTCHGPVTGKPMRDMLNAGTDHLRKNGATKWLSDDRQNPALSEDDIVYGLTDWGPRTAKAGWKFWALVVPESIAGRASMRDLIEAYHNMGVRVAVFTKLQDAFDWLKKQ